jgi:NAD(P)-dependent dehydrogenase (short-subunit alcohol dehydrogenase family)
MLEPAVLLVTAGGFRSMKGALVTGAGMRVGRALAMALAADGFFAFVHYNRSAGPARDTVAEIVAAGGSAKAVHADLSSARQAETLVGKCRARGVHLTCLVNSASLFKLDRAPTAEPADFDQHMAVNLRAPLLLSQALARQLPAGETGVIVNMLDQKLFNLNPDFLTYTLSKVGLQGLTTLLAQSFAPRLRVAGIAPGLTLRPTAQGKSPGCRRHDGRPGARAALHRGDTDLHRRRSDCRQRRAPERPAARHRFRHQEEEMTWPPTPIAASSSATSG